MSKVGKVFKKVFKGITKVVKKVVKSIGKVMNKLGPIGTIALSFIAPHAIGWMAAQNGTWIGTLGKAIQGVGQAISAPFKTIVGAGKNLLGSALGSVSEGVTTLFGENSISKVLSTASDSFLKSSGAGAWSPFEAGSNAFSETMSAASTNFREALDGVKSAMGITTDGIASTVNAGLPSDAMYDEYYNSSMGSVDKAVEQIGFSPEDIASTPGYQPTEMQSMLDANYDPYEYMTADRAGQIALDTPIAEAGEVFVKPDVIDVFDPENMTSNYDPMDIYDRPDMEYAINTDYKDPNNFLGVDQYGNEQTGFALSPDATYVPEPLRMENIGFNEEIGVKQDTSLVDKTKELASKLGKSLLGSAPDYGDLMGAAAAGGGTGGYDQVSAVGQKGAGEYGMGEDFYIVNSQGGITSASGSIGLRQGSQLASLLQQSLGRDMRGQAYA